jgi:hypothetical protein
MRCWQDLRVGYTIAALIAGTETAAILGEAMGPPWPRSRDSSWCL